MLMVRGGYSKITAGISTFHIGMYQSRVEGALLELPP